MALTPTNRGFGVLGLLLQRAGQQLPQMAQERETGQTEQKYKKLNALMQLLNMQNEETHRQGQLGFQQAELGKMDAYRQSMLGQQRESLAYQKERDEADRLLELKKLLTNSQLQRDLAGQKYNSGQTSDPLKNAKTAVIKDFLMSRDVGDQVQKITPGTLDTLRSLETSFQFPQPAPFKRNLPILGGYTKSKSSITREEALSELRRRGVI